MIADPFRVDDALAGDFERNPGHVDKTCIPGIPLLRLRQFWPRSSFETYTINRGWVRQSGIPPRRLFAKVEHGRGCAAPPHFMNKAGQVYVVAFPQ